MKWKDFTQKLTEAKKTALETAQQYHQHFSVASSGANEAGGGTAARPLPGSVGVWHSGPAVPTEPFLEVANDGSTLRDLPTVATGGAVVSSPPGRPGATISASTPVLPEGPAPYGACSTTAGRGASGTYVPSHRSDEGVGPTKEGGIARGSTYHPLHTPLPPAPCVEPAVVCGDTSCAPRYAGGALSSCASSSEGSVVASGGAVEEDESTIGDKGSRVQLLKADVMNLDGEAGAAAGSGSKSGICEMDSIHTGGEDTVVAGHCTAPPPPPPPPPSGPVGMSPGGSWSIQAELSAVPREKLEQAFEILHRRSVRLSEELQEKEKLRSAASMLASEYVEQVQKLQETCASQEEALRLAQRETAMFRGYLENEQAQNGPLREQIAELNRQMCLSTSATEELRQLRADLSEQVALLAKDAAVLRNENASLKDIVSTLQKEKEALVRDIHSSKMVVDAREAEKETDAEQQTSQDVFYVGPATPLILHGPALRCQKEDADVPPTEDSALCEAPADLLSLPHSTVSSAPVEDYHDTSRYEAGSKRSIPATVSCTYCSTCSCLTPVAPKLASFLEERLSMKDSEASVIAWHDVQLELLCLLTALREMSTVAPSIEFEGSVEGPHPEILAWVVREQAALMRMCVTLIHRLETAPPSAFGKSGDVHLPFNVDDRTTILNYLKSLQRGLQHAAYGGNFPLQRGYRVVSIAFSPVSAAEIGTVTDTFISEERLSGAKDENLLDSRLHHRISYRSPDADGGRCSQQRHSEGLSVASILPLYTELLNIFQIQVSELRHASREEDFTRAFGTVALVLETLEERMPKTPEAEELGTKARELFQTVVTVLRLRPVDVSENGNDVSTQQRDQRRVNDPLPNHYNGSGTEGSRSPAEATDTIIAELERQVKNLTDDQMRVEEELQITRDAFVECKTCLGITQQSLMQTNGQLRESCATVSKLEEALSGAYQDCAASKKRAEELEQALRPPKQSVLEEEGLQLRALLKVTVPDDGGRSWCCLRVEPRVPVAAPELKTSLNIRGQWNRLYWIPTVELESFFSGSELLDVQQIYGKEINAYQISLQQEQQRVKTLERQLEEVEKTFKAYQDKATVALRRQETSRSPEKGQIGSEFVPDDHAGREATKFVSKAGLEGSLPQARPVEGLELLPSTDGLARLRYTETEFEKQKVEVERLQAHVRQYAVDVAKAEAVLRDEREQHAQSKELRRTEALKFAEIQSGLEGRLKRLQELLEKANQRVEQWSQKWVQQQSCNSVSGLQSETPSCYHPHSVSKDHKEHLEEDGQHNDKRRSSSGVAFESEMGRLCFASSKPRYSEGALPVRTNGECLVKKKRSNTGFTTDINETTCELLQQGGETSGKAQKTEDARTLEQPLKTEDSLHLEEAHSERLASNVSSSAGFSLSHLNETPRQQTGHSCHSTRFLPGLIATPSVKGWPSESQSLRRQLRVLERQLAEQKHQNALLFEQNACIKKELRKSEALLSIRFRVDDVQETGGGGNDGLPDGVPLEFVRNTVLRFVQTSPLGGSEHESLIPVIASLFAFSRDEVRDVCRLRGEKGGFIKPWFG